MQEPVWKKCNICAPGCEGQYDMVERAEAIRYSVFSSPPRADGCNNPKCQELPKPKKKGKI